MGIHYNNHEEAAATPPSNPQKSGGNLKIILIVLIVVLVIGNALTLYLFLNKQDGSKPIPNDTGQNNTPPIVNEVIDNEQADENSEPGYFIMGNEIQSSNYQCEPKYTPSEMGVPDTKGVISGCYNKDCPTFDNTKCFGTDGIMPAKGIFSSMKCGCIPGTISHLQNWIKIMNNIKIRNELLTTGKTNIFTTLPLFSYSCRFTGIII